jgi:hypothetical protein
LQGADVPASPPDDNAVSVYRDGGVAAAVRDSFPHLAFSASLNVNYRSHPDIIRFYNEWMNEQTWDEGKYSFRFAKKILIR